MDLKYCPVCASPLQHRAVGGRGRLVCGDDGCDYVFWDNPAPVVAAIVEHEGEIVLARNVGWPEKMFGLVSGYLEQGESPDEAILREIEEEIGLDGEIESFVGYYTFAEANQIIFVYHVKGRGQIVVDETELAAVTRVRPEKLQPWPRGTGPAVRDWLRAQGYTHLD